MLDDKQVQAALDALTAIEKAKEAAAAKVTPPTEAQTAKLAEQQKTARDAMLAQTATTLNVTPAEITKMAAESEQDQQQLAERMTSRSVRHAEALAKMLDVKQQASDEERQDRGKAFHAALADHWWVEVKSGSRWRPLDILAARPWTTLIEIDTKAAKDKDAPPQFETVDLKAIPGALHHRLTIQVWAEQLLESGQLKRHLALEHTVRVGEMVGRHMTLTTAPMDVGNLSEAKAGDRAPEKMRKLLLAQTEWLPTIAIDDQVIKQGSITHLGTVNKSPALSLNARKVQSASSVLNALNASSAKTHLVAVAVQYKVESPQAKPQTSERMILDLVGPTARAAGNVALKMNDDRKADRALGMAGVTDVLTQPCWFSSAFLSYRGLSAILKNRVALLGPLHAGMQGDQDKALKYYDTMKHVPMPLYTLAAGRHKFNWDGDQLGITSTNLLTFNETMIAKSDKFAMRRGFDIVRNAVSARRDAAKSARYLRLVQGVLDTNAEAMAMPRKSEGLNAANAFERALASGDSWSLLRNEKDLQDASLDLKPDAMFRLQRALERGHWVITPKRPVTLAGITEPVWWQVDAETGTTLGMASDGRGSVSTEGLQIYANAFSVLMALRGLDQCLGMRGNAQICCLVQNGVANAVGLGLGRAMIGAGVSALNQIYVNVTYTYLSAAVNFCGD